MINCAYNELHELNLCSNVAIEEINAIGNKGLREIIIFKSNTTAHPLLTLDESCKKQLCNE